jgi:7-cyano-7-deazaguanine synthase in queuosine biosynthesis
LAVKEKAMSMVSISKPEYTTEEGWHVASAMISINEKTFEMKCKVSEGPLAEGFEPFLAAALLPAMKVGQPLHVSGKVSPKLLAGIQTVQAILHKWFPEFQKIPVEAEAGVTEKEGNAEGVGAFFSGGVDSFYTLLKHQDEIEKIILINGIMHENTSVMPKVTGEMRRIAREMGKSLIVVEVNLRDLSDQYTDWADHYVGSALASIGLLLSPKFRKIYVPATFSYEHLHPEGSHPLLDPLWSTETLTFVHDGCEANRIEKIAYVSQSDIALELLRVCNRIYSHNCGQCEKCLRTMLGLHAVGALDRCTSFDKKLDADALYRMKIMHDSVVPYEEENLSVLEKRGDSNGLAEALQFSINSYKFKKMARELNESFSGFLSSEQGARFVSGKRNTILRSLWQTERKWLLREVFKEKVKGVDEKYLFGIMRRLFGKV